MNWCIRVVVGLVAWTVSEPERWQFVLQLLLVPLKINVTYSNGLLITDNNIDTDSYCCSLHTCSFWRSQENELGISSKGSFTRCENLCNKSIDIGEKHTATSLRPRDEKCVSDVCEQLQSFNGVDCTALNGSVHTGTCISKFYCNTDLNSNYDFYIWCCPWRSVWMDFKCRFFPWKFISVISKAKLSCRFGVSGVNDVAKKKWVDCPFET